MGYIEDGKKAGAQTIIGGERHGSEGYFIQPTIFTNTTSDMRIVREEIFGPVGVLVKFEDENGMNCHFVPKSRDEARSWTQISFVWLTTQCMAWRQPYSPKILVVR
jgi:Aldehyde dehydrogenase family